MSMQCCSFLNGLYTKKIGHDFLDGTRRTRRCKCDIFKPIYFAEHLYRQGRMPDIVRNYDEYVAKMRLLGLTTTPPSSTTLDPKKKDS